MHKIAIIDDEERDRLNTETLVCSCCAELGIDSTIRCYSSGEEYLDSNTPADIIFMDIYMQGMGGIRTAEMIKQTTPNAFLVFLTSSRDHYPEAFKCHAFDYITKPTVKAEMLDTLRDMIKAGLKGADKTLSADVDGTQVALLFNRIRYIQQDKSSVVVHEDKEYRLTLKYKELRKTFKQDSRFIEINKGVIVNLDWVTDMRDNICIMTKGVQLDLNRSKRHELIHEFISWQFKKRTEAID